jgi:hypothetical protein
MSTPTEDRTAKDWDKVRMEFHTSIMVDTSLNSLAQNLDGPDWPLQGKEETPAKYIDLSFDELRLVPGLNGHPARINQLIDILEETVAFDSPFGEMIAQSTAAEEEENPLLKNLTRLGIPLDFPVEGTLVSADVKGFCQLEKIATLSDFANFAQKMPPQVVVGGDFRKLLNAVAHVNESALTTLLPFRAGSKGLHLPEALGQLVDSFPPPERLALFRRYGLKLTEPEEKQAAALGRERLAGTEEAFQQRVAQVLNYFGDDVRTLPATVKERGSLARYLVVLGNPRKEALVAKLLEPVLKLAEPPAAPTSQRKRGLWGTVAGWFRR